MVKILSLMVTLSLLQSLAFDVASVRLSKSGERGRINALPESGRLVITNTSVAEVIQAAYGIQPSQLITRCC